jgi:hypothetical protein
MMSTWQASINNGVRSRRSRRAKRQLLHLPEQSRKPSASFHPAQGRRDPDFASACSLRVGDSVQLVAKAEDKTHASVREAVN